MQIALRQVTLRRAAKPKRNKTENSSNVFAWTKCCGKDFGIEVAVFCVPRRYAQWFAFGVSGVVTKPVESARQSGLFGLAEGLGRAFPGFVVLPMSGALDFFSLTVDGTGASCSREAMVMWCASGDMFQVPHYS
ncbi:pleckstrin-like protein [Thalictrum thalictroides]|uniref:Pleckstrin-like protein n=1 Tax=Thalictrum thalictroides TaxID=46969 RepID=A0A7J6VXD7_THATH|nr:pleckstrin-like protein [Thalictrum thalictroides]